MNNTNLKNELLYRIKQTVTSWNVHDIYVISLFVNDYYDNPCEPTVTLGYNTETQYNNSIASASDKKEARWNYAFWLQNEELVFGEEGETKEIVKNWVIDNGWPYIPDLFDIPDELDDEIEKITAGFVNILIEVVKDLHKTGFIKKKFGKTIPIIIHELEYYDEIIQQNKKANPNSVIKDFIAWIDEMG